mmetsp:Transcript_14195/g.28076  ORF Transcript_14195/g.28076 Transcript_14195/m.28076 type:complete len:254 (-) Transcript_14195:111-872(-)
MSTTAELPVVVTLVIDDVGIQTAEAPSPVVVKGATVAAGTFAVNDVIVPRGGLARRIRRGLLDTGLPGCTSDGGPGGSIPSVNATFSDWPNAMVGLSEVGGSTEPPVGSCCGIVCSKRSRPFGGLTSGQFRNDSAGLEVGDKPVVGEALPVDAQEVTAGVSDEPSSTGPALPSLRCSRAAMLKARRRRWPNFVTLMEHSRSRSVSVNRTTPVTSWSLNFCCNSAKPMEAKNCLTSATVHLEGGPEGTRGAAVA